MRKCKQFIKFETEKFDEIKKSEKKWGGPQYEFRLKVFVNEYELIGPHNITVYEGNDLVEALRAVCKYFGFELKEITANLISPQTRGWIP